MTRLSFEPLPIPCPDAIPTVAPALYLDAGGALHWTDGTTAIVIYPWGQIGHRSPRSHAYTWADDCTDLSSGVTLHPVPVSGRAEEPMRSQRAMLLGALDMSDPSTWREQIVQAVLEAGGTYPLRAGQIDGTVAELSLHGVVGFGTTEDEAIRNWIASARVAMRPRRSDIAYCGNRAPLALMAALRAAEGRVEE